MPRNTYLYENRMCTNTVKCRIVWGGERRKLSNDNLRKIRRQEALEALEALY